MKNILHRLVLLGAFVSLFSTFAVIVPAHTSTTTTHPLFTAAGLVTLLTPVIVPLVIAGVKKVLPQIPTWLLPVLAPILGVVADLINSWASGAQTNLALAAVLGLAGVGVREVKDQLLPPKTTPTS